MKKYIIAYSIFFFAFTSQAQVGMSTNSPNKDAALDLNTTSGGNTKGLLLPKVSLANTATASPFSSHIAGMHVYNTYLGTAGATQVTPGEYYNDGSKWVRLQTDSWEINANTGTTAATNFVGTTDAVDLNVVTNATTRMYLPKDGGLLIGAIKTKPAGSKNAILMTDQPLQIIDGTQGKGRTLVSDANGVGSWFENGNTTFGTGKFISTTAQTFPNNVSTQLQTSIPIKVTAGGSYMIYLRWRGKSDGPNASTKNVSAFFELYKNGVLADELECYQGLLTASDEFSIISCLYVSDCMPNDILTINIKPNIGITSGKWYTGTPSTNPAYMPSLLVIKL